MEYNQITVEVEKLGKEDLWKLRQFVDGLIQKQLMSVVTSQYLPVIGKEYVVGDRRHGSFKVKVIKLRRKKAVCEVLEQVTYGPSRKNFPIHSNMNVPFTLFTKE